jgi:hypothetical protein
VLLGDEAVCLVSKRFPKANRGAIPETARLEPREFVDKIAQVLERPRTAAQLFVYDGHTGHCVTVHRALPERRGFEYHDPWPTGSDPWPEGSFLVAGRNKAGVKAQPLGTRWFVSEADLEKVAFAAFVTHGSWALTNGDEYRVSIDGLKKSDFWTFFAMTESERFLSPDGLTRRRTLYNPAHLARRRSAATTSPSAK